MLIDVGINSFNCNVTEGDDILSVFTIISFFCRPVKLPTMNLPFSFPSSDGRYINLSQLTVVQPHDVIISIILTGALPLFLNENEKSSEFLLTTSSIVVVLNDRLAYKVVVMKAIIG